MLLQLIAITYNICLPSISRNPEVTSVGASRLFKALEKLPCLVEIDIVDCSIDDDCMESLASLLENNENLRMLILSTSQSNVIKGNLTDKAIEILFPSLIGNIGLKEIDFTNAHLSDKSLSSLKEICEKSCLERIKLVGTLIGHEDILEINRLLRIPESDREIPLKSLTKSAAKR